MTYREFIGYTKTYIVVHSNGFGVMENPYREIGIVYETNDLEEAKRIAKGLEYVTNTDEDIKSSWIWNTYWININTLSEEGKKLKEQFNKDFDRRWEEMKGDDVVITKIGDMEVKSRRVPLFENHLHTMRAMDSYKIVFIDVNDKCDKCG